MLDFFRRFFWWRSLDLKTCTKLSCFVERTEKDTPKQQIIEHDKIYHHILKELWYQGNFWDILKRNPKEIKNINEVWELHKLRNSLVHELQNRNKEFLTTQAQKYKQINKKFLKQVMK